MRSKSIHHSTVRTSSPPTRAGPTACQRISAVKLPRSISHQQRLADAGTCWRAWTPRSARSALLACWLQTPPSLALDLAVAGRFFTALRARYGGMLACEARHPSWFGTEGTALLQQHMA
jgi:uncharacterized protein YecE (DUF72 family)